MGADAQISRRDWLRGRFRPSAPETDLVAALDTAACLAHTCSFCTVCSEHCPAPGAITVTRGRPEIHQSACTGCGKCIPVCPAPRAAIWMRPRLPHERLEGN